MSEDFNDGISFAVTVTQVDGAWQVREFDDDFEDVQTSIKAVRALRSPSAAFALLCVEDEYFVIVRPVPGGVRIALSDAVVAVEDDFAADFLDLRDIDVPDLDEDEIDDADPYAEGDLDILADLGLNEDQLGYIASDDEDYASDMLLRIAGELGFGDELEDIINGEDE